MFTASVKTGRESLCASRRTKPITAQPNACGVWGVLAKRHSTESVLPSPRALRYDPGTYNLRGKKNMNMKNIGFTLLGVWLIATGLRGVVNFSFQYDSLIFGIIAIVAGVLIILKR